MVLSICLKTNGEIKEFDLNENHVDNINLETFNSIKLKNIQPQKNCRKCQPEKIENSGFEFDKNKILIYVWKEGNAGQENKHELPPPNDKELYFDNIYIIACNKKKIIPLTRVEFKNLYKKAFKGFYSIGDVDSERSSDSDSTGSLNSFIVSDNESLNYDGDSDFSEEEYYEKIDDSSSNESHVYSESSENSDN